MADSVTRRLLKEEAQRRGWQISEIIRDGYFLKITDNHGVTEWFLGSRPLIGSANGSIICIQKDMALEYLESLGYKVPAYLVVDKPGRPEAEEFIAQHGTIVAKPLDGKQSEGVTTNITSLEQLNPAIDLALENSRWGKVLLQAQVSGKLYRLFAVNGKLRAAAHRKAAEVTGNGQNTVKQLIEQLNSDPRRGDDSTTPLKKVKLADAKAYLGAEGLEAVPEPGRVVRVSLLDSISAGGEAVNVMDQVHPDWHKMVSDVTVPINLFVCGFDVMCEDISQPLTDKFVPLLEMNSSPGLKLHHFPTGGGEPIDLAAIILDEVFGIEKN